MISLLIGLLLQAQLIGPLTLAPADPGVLERVAERRANWEQVPANWQDYQVLAGVANCAHVGQHGYLIGDDVQTVLVTDCARPEHQAEAQGLIDVNQDRRGEGLLILWR